jgi:Flp pilus assembly protein TadD
MAQDLINARRHLSQINTQLRQGKIMPAVQALHSALNIVIRQSLMKAEKDEFERMFTDAVLRLNNDKSLRAIYPLALEYGPGSEKRLIADLAELLDMLQEESMAEAEGIAQALIAKKAAVLAEGQGYLDAAEHDKARGVFNALIETYPDDSDLRADIGERVLKAGLYEDAVEHLTAAVEQAPYVLHYYNRLGIALRKLGRFDVAEFYYLKALPLAPDDPNLHFNVGRLYLEWTKWDKAVEHGDTAAALNPDFVEAKKLSEFARKKLEAAKV